MERRSLGRLGDKLGSGGQAVVYDLPDFSLPDVRSGLVYKEYRAGQQPPSGLSSIVGLRTNLDDAGRRRLDEIATWPARVVVDADVVRGIVMPRIPDSYFARIRLLGSGTDELTPRDVQYLFIPPDLAARLHLPVPTTEQRLAICRDFAEGLAFLHEELKVAFGDLNAKNELFRLAPEPMVMFIDCDAVRRSGSGAVVRQLESPDWDPPKGSAPSQLTDRYKLGLFVLRCLTPGAGSSTNRVPDAAAAVLDQEGMNLLVQAIQGREDQRPHASQWVDYLYRRLGQHRSPPVMRSVVLDRNVVVRGNPVLVSWDADDAVTVEITAGGIDVVRGDARRGVLAVYPVMSGSFHVCVHNKIGFDHSTTDPVAVLDLPATSPLAVPMPVFPAPAAGAVPLPDVTSTPAPLYGVPDLPLTGLGSRPPSLPFTPERTSMNPPIFESIADECPVDIATMMSAGEPW